MATRTHVSVNGKAKPARRIYCSVGGKAKLVKRIYGSVGGKAKIVYDTVVVTVYNNNIQKTQIAQFRVAKHCKCEPEVPTSLGNYFLKSDGTVLSGTIRNFTPTADTTLYYHYYVQQSSISFNGSQGVRFTNFVINSDDLDLRISYEVTSTASSSATYVCSIWSGNPTYGFLYMFSDADDGKHPEGIPNIDNKAYWSNMKATWMSKMTGGYHTRLNLRPDEEYNYLQVWEPNGSSGWFGGTKRFSNSRNTNGNLCIGNANQTQTGLIGSVSAMDFRDAKHNFVPYLRYQNSSGTRTSTYGFNYYLNNVFQRFAARENYSS